MKYLMFIVLFILSNYLNAQISFDDHVIDDLSNRVEKPSSICVTDVDGDGNNDILVASSNSSGIIVWYKNERNGVFGNQNIIATNTSEIRSVFAIDIDNDGDIDILSASSYYDRIAWYENLDGQGNFGTLQIITTNANGAQSVFANDIDGDGFVDVLSASAGDDKIAWYKNIDGNGNFGSQQIISTDADLAKSVFSTDLDGDGDMDVLSASYYDDKIAWYENVDGEGTFGSQQIISTDADSATSVFAVDIDSDGDMDVLSASSGDDKIAWYKNTDGQGNFGAQQIISSSADGASSIFASDIDGDNDIDVLSASSNDDKIAWYENIDGIGTFDSPQIITLEANYAKGVFASDIDGDGFIDVQSISHSDDKIAWYKNLDGEGSFSYLKNIGAYIDNPKATISTDINNDGYMDIVSTTERSGYHDIVWYKNLDGLGTFDTQRVLAFVDDHLKHIHVCDIDGDNDMDVLSVAGNSFHISWYENIDGQGNFGESQSIGYSIMPDFVHSADIDGDGDNDILMTSSSDNEIAWFENLDGQGNFGTQNIITTSLDFPSSLYAVDLDGDDDMDIISSSAYDDTIAWHENIDGQGNFGLLKVISWQADAATSVFAEDIDGDGDMDVLSASIADDKIAWYENIDGQGNFGGEIIITESANSAQSVYSVDMDGDGDFDVLSASSSDDKIAWYENLDGEGNFGNQQIIGNNNYALSVFSVDIDNDGDMDVLSCYNHGVNLYENTGFIGFTEQSLLAFSVFPNPSNDLIEIDLESKIKFITLYNLKCQIILTKQNPKKLIDLSMLNSGVYFLKVRDENGNTGINKIIKI